MNKRRFRRAKKISFLGTSRTVKIHNALMSGLCVDCGHAIEEVSPQDPDYLGVNHTRCPNCGWVAQWESSF